MIIPKWLLPVLSIVAAIAVGVAATLIGMNFVPHVQAAAPIVTAPVLQPVDRAAKKDSSGHALPSVATGAIQVVGTGAAEDQKAPITPANDPGFTKVLAAIGHALNPAAEVARIQKSAGESPTLVGGDPCSPIDGKPASGCPTGTTGAIAALLHAPALAVTGQAYPPSESDFTSRGNPIGDLWCPTPTGGGANDVPFGILTTAPATFRVNYFPDGHSDQSRSLAVDAPENSADWQSHLAGAATAADLPVLKQCVSLPNLTPNTVYDAIVVATQASGMIAISSIVRFNSSRHPVRPPATFTPLGDNYVFAQGLVGHQQSLTFKAWIVNATDADRSASSHTCSTPNGQELIAIAGHRDDVSQRDLQALNAPTDYNLRLTSVFVVPEGATVLFCARWYSATIHAPSWTREQPEFETSTFLGAPDRILPVLTEVSNGFINIRRVRQTFLQVATVSGVDCGGGYVYGISDALGLQRGGPQVVCDPSQLATATAFRDGDRFWEQPFNGNLAIKTVYSDGHLRDPQYTVIDAGLQNCFGVCALPAPSTFVIPVGPAYYDCSHPTLGTCTPQPGSGYGQYEIDLSWVQGLTNGVGVGWGTTSVNDVSLDWHQPDMPRMNTDERLTTAPGHVLGSAVVSFHLEVDRPVHYQAILFNPAVDTSPPCFVEASDSPTQVGAATNDVTLTWPDLCGGQAVAAEIMLTDDATGIASLYDFRRSPEGSPRWGLHGVVIVPVIAPATAHVSWEFDAASRFGYSALVGSFVSDESRGPQAGEPQFTESNFDGRCTALASFSGSFDLPVTVQANSAIVLAFTVTTPDAGCEARQTAELLSADLPLDAATLSANGQQVFYIDTADDAGTPYQIRVTVTV